MENLIAKRVRLRLEAMDITASEAAKKAGLNRGFVNELLHGKKSQPRLAGLEKLAPILNCDVEYLLLYQRAPRKGMIPEDGVPLVGVCQSNNWRRPGDKITEIGAGTSPLEPVYGFNEDAQVAYLVRGDHAENMGIHSEAIVIALRNPEQNGRPVITGDVVVASIWDSNNKAETILALSGGIVNGKHTIQRTDDEEIDGEVTIEALGLSVTEYLARPLPLAHA